MDFDRPCHFWHLAIIKETFKALKRRKKLAINGSIGKSSEQKSSKFTKPLPAAVNKHNSVFMRLHMIMNVKYYEHKLNVD